MRFGTHVADFTLAGGPRAIAPAPPETARAADDGGGAILTRMDHGFQVEGASSPSEDPMLEGDTFLGFLAARTDQHHSLTETICSPAPIERPGPALLVCDGGEKKTLRFVAKDAHACHLFDIGSAALTHTLAVLAERCGREGRDCSTIQRTVITGADPLGDVDGFLSAMEEYPAIDIDQEWVGPTGDDPAGWTRSVTAAVVPRLRES